MSDRADPRDEELLARLRELAARVDPPPQAVVESARAAFTWRTVDQELLALSDDARLDPAPAGVRGRGSAQLLTFTGRSLEIELQVEDRADGTRRLTAQLVPPQPAAIVLQHPTGEVGTRADDLGRFLLEGVPPGHMRILAGTAAGETVVTEWTTI